MVSFERLEFRVSLFGKRDETDKTEREKIKGLSKLGRCICHICIICLSGQKNN